MRYAKTALGQQGERLAKHCLARLGATVLEHNYRTPYGEADLIVSHEGDLVVVEVKTTSTGASIRPEDHADPRKLRRLERIIGYYAATRDRREPGWRIDVVAVEIDRYTGRVDRLERIRNAHF